MSKMFNEVEKSSKRKRERSLTTNTVEGLLHTLNGPVDVCESLQTTNHEFLMLASFSTDPLEREIDKLRQRSGGIYFLSVQQVIENLKIKNAIQILRYIMIACDEVRER